MLEDSDVDPNARNPFCENWTALHYAVNTGYLDVVKLLIDHFDVQIEGRTNQNKTPFHLACRRGDSPTIKYLISKGCCTTVVDRDGCTPLHYLCETQNKEMIKYVLPYSSACKDVRNKFGKKPSDLVCDQELKKLMQQNDKRGESGNSRGGPS